MAKPKRVGFDSFSLSVEFLADEKLNEVVKRNGDSAIVIILAILARLYRHNGYYFQFDSLMQRLIQCDLGMRYPAEHIRNVVEQAVDVGLFDLRMFRAHKILTSAEIQDSFLGLSKTAGRRKPEIKPEHLLIQIPEKKVPRTEEEIHELIVFLVRSWNGYRKDRPELMIPDETISNPVLIESMRELLDKHGDISEKYRWLDIFQHLMIESPDTPLEQVICDYPTFEHFYLLGEPVNHIPGMATPTSTGLHPAQTLAAQLRRDGCPEDKITEAAERLYKRHPVKQAETERPAPDAFAPTTPERGRELVEQFEEMYGRIRQENRMTAEASESPAEASAPTAECTEICEAPGMGGGVVTVVDACTPPSAYDSRPYEVQTVYVTNESAAPAETAPATDTPEDTAKAGSAREPVETKPAVTPAAPAKPSGAGGRPGGYRNFFGNRDDVIELDGEIVVSEQDKKRQERLEKEKKEMDEILERQGIGTEEGEPADVELLRQWKKHPGFQYKYEYDPELSPALEAIIDEYSSTFAVLREKAEDRHLFQPIPRKVAEDAYGLWALRLLLRIDERAADPGFWHTIFEEMLWFYDNMPKGHDLRAYIEHMNSLFDIQGEIPWYVKENYTPKKNDEPYDESDIEITFRLWRDMVFNTEYCCVHGARCEEAKRYLKHKQEEAEREREEGRDRRAEEQRDGSAEAAEAPEAAEAAGDGGVGGTEPVTQVRPAQNRKPAAREDSGGGSVMDHLDMTCEERMAKFPELSKAPGKPIGDRSDPMPWAVKNPPSWKEAVNSPVYCEELPHGRSIRSRETP